jgi:hypothetical protein
MFLNMSASYILSEATLDDAHAIASIFAQSWVSPFSLLQYGHVDTSAFATAIAPRIKDQIGKSHMRFIVMRYHDTEKAGEQGIAAVAHWELPHKEEIGTRDESAEDKAEREAFEDEVYRNRLPETSNKDLVMEFTVALRRLREQVLDGQKYYRMSFPSHLV